MSFSLVSDIDAIIDKAIKNAGDYREQRRALFNVTTAFLEHAYQESERLMQCEHDEFAAAADARDLAGEIRAADRIGRR